MSSNQQPGHEPYRVKLTISSLKGLVRPSASNPYIWDGELRSFGVRVGHDGAISFVVRYRLRGQQKIMTLGKLGDLTPEEARRRAQKARSETLDGADPMAKRQAERAQDSLADVWADFAADRAKATFRKRRPWKPKTAEEYRKAFRNYIGPQLGHRPVNSITLADVEALRDTITSGRAKPKRANGQSIAHLGRRAVADRTLAYLEGFFTWAQVKGRFVGVHPVKDAGRVHDYKPRERVLDDDELHRFMMALNTYAGSVYVQAALKLYVYTACRREEVLTLRWENVVLTGDYPHLRLRDAKGGDRNVPLYEQAVNVLRDLPRLQGNPHVICGDKPGSHLVNVVGPFKALLRTAGISQGVTIHDLRRTFGTQCLKDGMDIYALSKLLGHASVTITEKAYAFMPEGKMREHSDRAGRRIDLAAGGQYPRPRTDGKA